LDVQSAKEDFLLLGALVSLAVVPAPTLLEVAPGPVSIGVYTVEKLDTADEVAAATIAQFGCQNASPQPGKSLAANACGFCPLWTAAAALGRSRTTEIDVLRDVTPVAEITSTARDCKRTSMTAPGRLFLESWFVLRLLMNVHWPLTKDEARQLALKEQALLHAARLE
jgi:hypothetical protein